MKKIINKIINILSIEFDFSDLKITEKEII